MYAYGRDAKMRPIIIIELRKMIDSEMSDADFMATLEILLSYTTQNALLPGQIEQYTVIVDARGIALYEVPINSLVGISKRLTIFYKHRSCQTLFIGVAWVIRAATKFVFKLMDPFQRQKLVMYGDDDFKDALDERIGLDYLEQKFFGNLPNLETHSFPPVYNLWQESPTK